MLDMVLELERNGRSLQHFCRELARYFRNLLVAKVAGANTRLIAASAHEQQRLAEIAAGFSEDDLTRYLQLTLDLFKDLQFSLQPRLHLEIGLLRLVQAGRLLPIEEALADLGSTGAPRRRTHGATTRPGHPPQATSHAPPTPITSHQPPATAAAGNAPAAPGAIACTRRSSKRACSSPPTPSSTPRSSESNGELQFTTPAEFSLAMNEKDILKIVQKIAGRPMRVKIDAGHAAGGSHAAARCNRRRGLRARARSSGGQALSGAVSRRAGPRGAKFERIRQDTMKSRQTCRP